MSVFDLDTEGQQALADEAAKNPIAADQVTPTFFSGLPKAVTYAPFRGVYAAAKGVAILSNAATIAAEKIGGLDSSASDYNFSLIDKYLGKPIDDLTPSAAETGTAGRILGDTIAGLAPLGAGEAVGLPIMLATANQQTASNLLSQGVSTPRALAAGNVAATANALGFKIPFLGSTLKAKIASGVAGNVGLGMASREAQSLLTEGTPAEGQSRLLDPEGMAVDTLFGIAFGTFSHVTTPRVPPSVGDAVLTTNNAKHFQSDTAPGLPADWNASIAHQEALETAIKQTLEGEPVNVGHTSVQDQAFIPRETSPMPTIPPEHIVETQPTVDLPPELQAIPTGEGLNAGDRMIETNFRQQLQRDPQAAMDAYAANPDSAGGKILNTDIARELSPDYLKDRTKSAAVHEPASAIVKAMYTQKLTEAPKPGEEPLVVFSAGGTGAGKTTGLELTGLDKKAQIVYDSNMNSLSSSVKRIDQALAAGKQVQILYTYRDPVDALANGALPRATRQEKEFGTGRTVPLAKHAETHVGAAEVVRQLADKYTNDPRVYIKTIDNTHGKGKAKVSDLSVVPHAGKAHTDLEGKLHEALDQQFKAGKISESIYKGFKGEQPATREALQSEGVRGPASAGSGQHPKSPGDGGKVDPIVKAARDIAATSDTQIPTGEINADGTPKTATAKELMAQAEADIKQSEIDSKAFEAAVTCFLSVGAA